MISRRNGFVCAVLLGSLLGRLWSQQGPEAAVGATKEFDVRTVVSGLANPWEVTWGPDNQLWVTERSGRRIVRVDPATGARTVAIEIAEASAPGGQDGVLGLALHPKLLKGAGQDIVYVSYTYVDKAKGPDPEVKVETSPYRYLYMKIVRLKYTAADGRLSDPVDVITGLPAGNDHVGGRLKLGPDGKLYLTIGDQGHNQLGNFCLPAEAQRLPTADEIARKDYVAYVGKTLRINPDGSVPKDNPKLGGVVSHVFTYGHRNTQGIDFAPDGTLYGAEHGPKTDDEVNILKKGGNYGWPNVAGFRDDKAYEYARWAEAKTPCSTLRFSDLQIHESVPREKETAFRQPMVDPIATLFTVPTGFRFDDPVCKGIDFICWPTVAVSSIEHYQPAKGQGIPGWGRVLFVTALKRGSLYVVPLAPDGKSVSGPIARYFQSENRYRDTAVSPDGRTIFVATDSRGVVEGLRGGVATRMQNPGAILAFTYRREGTGAPVPPPVTTGETTVSQAREPEARSRRPVEGAIAPQFTAAQVASGKTAYNASCAVCHGSTLRNGTMGTPLAGEYFKRNWQGRTVRELFDRVHKTMPPSAPGSLSKDAYADIVAYMLEVNGATAGEKALAAGDAANDKMVVP